MSMVLSVRDAHKSFGAAKALDGASMTLNRGEWLALLGPNGAGKTTLIRSIAGRVILDQGTISLLGTTLDARAANGRQEAQAARARLGVIPQEIALYPLLTARENLRAFGELHGVTGQVLRERVNWALQWTALEDRADSLSKTFSGGMKRRLNIACGVLHRPDVVLLDEPTVGVDPQSRQRIWDMLGALRAEGASLLLTTHQLDEAQQVCDRITIIDHGKAIADGTMDELIRGTIGSGRSVSIVLEEPLPPATLNGSIEQDGLRLRCTVTDIATELPDLLERIKGAGGVVKDISVQSPTLHAVFLHLTGRELRE